MTDYQTQMAENHRNAKREIGWAKKTCNIVVGCSGAGCECRNICVAKEQFDRWHFNKDGTVNMWPKNQSFRDVQFYLERLKMLNEHRGSGNAYFYFPIMGDPFDDKSPLVSKSVWLPQFGLSLRNTEWNLIIESLHRNPQSHLVLLTKQPQNIPADLPDLPNLWIGVSTDGTGNILQRVLYFTEEVKYPRKVISLEPIHLALDRWAVDQIQWLIIGGRSQGMHKATTPHIGRGGVRVVKNMIQHCQDTNIPVFTKSNLYQDRNGNRFPGWEDFVPVRQWPEVEVS